MNLGIDILLEKIWDLLGLVRVYTKKKGCLPDFSDPLILTYGRHGCTIKSAIMQIHKVSHSFPANFYFVGPLKRLELRLRLGQECEVLSLEVWSAPRAERRGCRSDYEEIQNCKVRKFV